MNEQPKALLLADFAFNGMNGFGDAIAAELRRLHATNTVLLEALQEVFSLEAQLLRDIYGSEFVEKARAAIAAATNGESA